MIRLMQLADKITFWKKKAQGHYQLANEHFQLKNYVWCLFLCHLALEKVLKARVLEKTKREAPYTHDLIVLAKLADIQLTDDLVEKLETITGFNIEARYEDYKETLKKKADKKYTQQYLTLAGEYLTWFSKPNWVKKK